MRSRYKGSGRLALSCADYMPNVSYMSQSTAKWLLWLVGVLVAPLPYLFMYDGAVPVVRYVLLTIVTGTYALLIDGSAVAWPLVAILAAHALLYAVLLIAPATLVARIIAPHWRTRVVAAFFIVGFTIAIGLPIYETPADDVSARANWIDLFQ